MYLRGRYVSLPWGLKPAHDCVVFWAAEEQQQQQQGEGCVALGGRRFFPRPGPTCATTESPALVSRGNRLAETSGRQPRRRSRSSRSPPRAAESDAPMEAAAALGRNNGSSAARWWGNASGGGVEGDEAWPGSSLAWPALLLLLLILALSAAGNGAVLLAIGRHRQLRTVTNAFVLSLALAELLGALLGLPPALAALLRGRPPGAWLLGPRLCRAAAALHAALGMAAALTLALLAFDRYCAIVRQPRRQMGRRRAARLLAAVWLAALGLAAPWLLLARGEEEEGAAGETPHCWYARPWGASSSSRLGPPYAAALIVLGYLLPFALMCFCHYHICRAVRLSESRVRPLTSCGPLLRSRGEMRTATTVLLMVVALICCWGPYCLLGLAAATGRAALSPTADALASWAAWANGALNPLIYAARNPNLAALFGRSRGGGYRTRNDLAAYLGAARGRRPEAKGRAERYASQGPATGSDLCSASPAGGGEVAMWACKNPALLFCRDGQPDTLSEVGAQLKPETVDTSL
ncbi:PREDICTED: probable G-protein coupled receptor 135 [Gekko japonicus]|uniref:Probable G-protein coupled receptor 135 n=1 Tax=Gekko japonicus TaxID=146911 RepID=A0ABM1KXX6_GEKJA|nr:PREDICTED: probable G-protein coupled receptor 135 [Gekko japonicus]